MNLYAMDVPVYHLHFFGARVYAMYRSRNQIIHLPMQVCYRFARTQQEEE